MRFSCDSHAVFPCDAEWHARKKKNTEEYVVAVLIEFYWPFSGTLDPSFSTSTDAKKTSELSPVLSSS